MKPEDPLAQKYDISFLAGEALREEEAKQVVNNLNKLFENGQTETVSVGKDLQYLNQRLEQLVGGFLYNYDSSKMSRPYDQFEYEGVEMVSRVINLHSDSTTGREFAGYDIYLIGLMGENQTTVSSKNCPIGAIKTTNGQIGFFKIEQNDNFGKVIVSQVVRDVESERALTEQGVIDTSEIKITALSPEERYLAVAEFEKAIKTLGSQQ